MKFSWSCLAIFFVMVEVTMGNFVKTFTVKNIQSWKAENPNAKLIEMDAYEHLDGARSYSMGARQTGDLVVANGSDKKSWHSPQNVSTTLSYPRQGGYGAYLTYVIVHCDQSSNLGRAYVVHGGVYQHFIQIVVEANVTTYFNYSALFYGFSHQRTKSGKFVGKTDENLI